MYYVYRPDGKLECCVKDRYVALFMAEHCGGWSEIRDIDDRVLWRQGEEGVTLADSFDKCEQILLGRARGLLLNLG